MPQYSKLSQDAENGQGHAPFVHFDESNPKHRCLCGSCHVVTATKILLGLLILTATLRLALTIQHQTHNDSTNFFHMMIELGVIICTSFAVKKENSGLMWPYIVMTAFSFVVSLLATVAFVIAAILYPTSMYDACQNFMQGPGGFEHSEKLTKFGFIVMMLVFALILTLTTLFSYWFMRIAYRCMQYFQEKSLVKNAAFGCSALLSNDHHLSPAQQHYALANGYYQSPSYNTAPFVHNASIHKGKEAMDV